MNVRELIKELIECDLEAEIKIKLLASTMPDGKDYISGVDIHAIDLNESEIVLVSGEFINEDGKNLTHLLKQCKLTGDGITEFAEYIKDDDKIF
jgi:hypothetical protein